MIYEKFTFTEKMNESYAVCVASAFVQITSSDGD